MKKSFLLTIVTFYFSLSIYSQSNYYINQQTGSDLNNGLTSSTPFKTVKHYTKTSNGFITAGDSIFLMGEFSNDSYNASYSYSGILDAHLWHAENTIYINNVNGNASNYITFLPYDATTKLKGDGANIFRVQNSSYINIVGFEIEGEVTRIPLSTAFAVQFIYQESTSIDPLNPLAGEVIYRVQPGTPKSVIDTSTYPLLNNIKRPSYTDTRGMYLSNVNHINIKQNNIHHMPGGGLRVSECEYITIEENEVHYNSLRSYSGTHGLVVTKATSTDTLSGYKIWIVRNKVHHNYNEVFSWAPTKTIITPHLDEGKGISMQRNQVSNGWVNGRILIANNLCYWNGFSGVHSNDGDRMDFINNTCYMNSYTGTVTDTFENANNIGISSSDGDGMRMINNIIVVDNNVGGYALSSKNNPGLVVRNNLVLGLNGGTLRADPDVTTVEVNTLNSDPQFNNPVGFDFSLKSTSPAIGYADTTFAQAKDYLNFIRDNNPDAGALEFGATTSLLKLVETNFVAYPNPFNYQLFIETEVKINSIEVYDLMGKKANVSWNKINENEVKINTENLISGIYLILINNSARIVVKN